jgi:outer membrane murein-binding lipoprotein Lpp
LLLAVLLWTPTSIAQVPVDTGDTIEFTQGDGGAVECRIDSAVQVCTDAAFAGTVFDATGRSVSAVVDQATAGAGAGNYAAASVYNDFTVAGVATSLVEAQVSATFDWAGSILSAVPYEGELLLNLTVSDITGGAPGVAVATHTLFRQSRSGDQGVGGDTPSPESQIVSGANSSFIVKLRRGQTYRLAFQAVALGETLIEGAVQASAGAAWSSLSVSLEEDEAALLEALAAQVGVIDPKIDALEVKGDALEVKADRIEPKIDALEVKADRIEPKIDAIEVKADRIEPKIDALEVKGDALEVKADRLEAKVDALEVKGDALEVKVDRVEAKVDEVLEREIEENLAQCIPIASLYLPADFGGRLELVQDIVEEWILNSQDAGMDSHPAMRHYNRAVTAFEHGNYKSAYQRFCLSYKTLTRTGPRGNNGNGQDNGSDDPGTGDDPAINGK